MAALMRFWNLSQNDFGRQYYAAGVRSMLESWHNFFFNAFDPAAFISIDKPPLALWLQVASAKLLGFSGLSILLPQALVGVLAVAGVYAIVRNTYGGVAAVAAAAILALMPVAVAVDRSNNTESLLILILLLAAWLGMRAAETGRLALYCYAMALIGVGFNVKMGAALVLAPALALAYWLATPHLALARRLAHHCAAGTLLVAVALSWAVAFDLTPAGGRPYAGSTRNNSMLELALVHNGISRFMPQHQSFVPDQREIEDAQPRPVLTDTSPTGVQRLFRPAAAEQFAWFLPMVIAGLVFAWQAVHESRSLRWKVSTIIWTGWLLGYWAVLSFAS
ncbi:MAG: glycosyltransferase family 39 protein, partial [Proteobacteria bacterium]|nr:glycosyltransferase family 39 protein [Pseudomonadota bacterium]